MTAQNKTFSIQDSNSKQLNKIQEIWFNSYHADSRLPRMSDMTNSAVLRKKWTGLAVNGVWYIDILAG